MSGEVTFDAKGSDEPPSRSGAMKMHNRGEEAETTANTTRKPGVASKTASVSPQEDVAVNDSAPEQRAMAGKAARTNAP